MNGILNILKPPGMTSHDVVSIVRKTLHTKKVGHTGTLDPEAAGVLPVCIGKATKTVDALTNKRKKYRAVLHFGQITDTYDIYGAVLKQQKIDSIAPQKLIEVLPQFQGEIMQIPPIYSALKVNGKKLYQYARNHESVVIHPRPVQIDSIEFLRRIGPLDYMIDVVCSKGTYIRSLCHDIGQAIGCGAVMGQLIRLASTPFSIESALTLDELKEYAEANCVEEVLTPVEVIFNDCPSIEIKESAKKALCNGNIVYPQGIVNETSLVSLETDTLVKAYINHCFLGTAVVKYETETDRKGLKLLYNFSDN